MMHCVPIVCKILAPTSIRIFQCCHHDSHPTFFVVVQFIHAKKLPENAIFYDVLLDAMNPGKWFESHEGSFYVVCLPTVPQFNNKKISLNDKQKSNQMKEDGCQQDISFIHMLLLLSSLCKPSFSLADW